MSLDNCHYLSAAKSLNLAYTGSRTHWFCHLKCKTHTKFSSTEICSKFPRWTFLVQIIELSQPVMLLSGQNPVDPFPEVQTQQERSSCGAWGTAGRSTTWSIELPSTRRLTYRGASIAHGEAEVRRWVTQPHWKWADAGPVWPSLVGFRWCGSRRSLYCAWIEGGGCGDDVSTHQIC